jgi:hypothetical protein
MKGARKERLTRTIIVIAALIGVKPRARRPALLLDVAGHPHLLVARWLRES